MTRRTAAALVALLALLSATPANAGGPNEDLPPGHAWFEGEVIDLGYGWGEAEACVVWRDEDLVECFRTERQMEARTEQAERRRDEREDDDHVMMAASTCSNWLYLYEHTSFEGRVLQFRDRDTWQDLNVWGFDNELSSFKVGPCPVKLATGYDGGGSHYPGDTYAGAVVGSMGSWDDLVSSINIL